MELITRSPLQNQMVEEREVVSPSNKNFIEANTKKVSLEHLKRDCIIPVFAKDNESTISHYEFVQKTREIAQDLFPEFTISEPDIRTSHIIKGRIPSAIGKPAKELMEHEKTLYYERMGFILEIPEVVENVNGNKLTLTIGGVRSYSEQNLFSRKSPEKLKVFVGFNNSVCLNLCISTEGLADQIRVNSVNQLAEAVENLLSQYDRMKHLGMMERMNRYELSEAQFAHFIGKLRMFNFMDKTEQKQYFPVSLNDSQVNTIVKNYYHDPNFCRKEDGSINMWRIFNLLTEANKSSYIDNNLERNVNAYDLINELVNSLQNRTGNFFLNN